MNEHLNKRHVNNFTILSPQKQNLMSYFVHVHEKIPEGILDLQHY